LLRQKIAPHKSKKLISVSYYLKNILLFLIQKHIYILKNQIFNTIFGKKIGAKIKQKKIFVNS